MSSNQEICDESLQNQSGQAGCGIVKITHVFPQYLSDSMDNFTGFGEDEKVTGVAEVNFETRPQSQLLAFSGAFTSAQVMDVFETDIEHDNSSDRDGANTIFEETESISIGEVMKSPVFSEDESSDNSLWIDLGQSPLGSKNAGHPSKHKAASLSPPYQQCPKKAQRLRQHATCPDNSHLLCIHSDPDTCAPHLIKTRGAILTIDLASE
ncbi:Pyridoxal phosphate (PLP)-dependent transferase superfamily protein [Forsythia ovata]|uniref:Pyridoxal phosphate (PLP)-dependent transferase superfamily protein n=1 Tax=Forsythia ovata TaxID=205694 RepID=A0ABD1TLF5_9LAMI